MCGFESRRLHHNQEREHFMVRVMDNSGAITLGIPRRELEAIMAGNRYCLLGSHGVPHICIVFGETDEELMMRIHSFYPGAPPPPIIVDNR